MNFFAKERLTFWAIVVLVILNCVTLGALWLGRCHPRGPFAPGPPPPPPWLQGQPPAPHGGRHGPDGMRHGDFIEKELGLGGEKAAALRALKEEHFKKADALRAEAGGVKKELFALLFDGGADQAAVDAKIEALGKKRAEVERLVFSHFADVMKLCDEGQKKKLRDILERALPPPPPGQ